MDDADRVKQFCVFMARGYPPEEAARRAGYAAAGRERIAAELLCERAVRRKIANLSKELKLRTPAETARAGLERLALGNTDDVAGLLYDEGDALPPPVELFHVAEIKKPKGGGVEIKFFDRLKALAMLIELEDKEPDQAGSLLAALEKSAAGNGGEDDGTV